MVYLSSLSHQGLCNRLLLFALPLCGLLSPVDSYFRQQWISNTSGIVFHRGYTTYSLRGDWKFQPVPFDAQKNVLMLFEVLDSEARGISWTQKYSYYLPDKPETEYSNSSANWCGLYVKPGSNATNCTAGDYQTRLCPNRILESSTWPPKVATDFKQFLAVMYYEFFDCDVAPPTKLMTQNAVVVMKNTSRNVNTTMSNRTNVTSQHTQSTTATAPTHVSSTSAATERLRTTTKSNQNQKSSSPSPSTYLWVALVLGILLLVACVIILFLLVKIRKVKESAGALEKDDQQPTRSMVANELYDTHQPYSEKQTVDNELYNI